MLLATTPVGVVGAQSGSSAEASRDAATPGMEKLLGKMDPDPDEASVLPDVWCGEIGHEGARESCWESYSAAFRYHATGLEHRSVVFRWQHFSTRMIFFVVLALMVVGVYFAWVQFRAGLRATASGEDRNSEETHLEVSTSGIKVSSPVLGVIILTLSLAFFYLYLVYVYPVSELF